MALLCVKQFFPINCFHISGKNNGDIQCDQVTRFTLSWKYSFSTSSYDLVRRIWQRSIDSLPRNRSSEYRRPKNSFGIPLVPFPFRSIQFSSWRNSAHFVFRFLRILLFLVVSSASFLFFDEEVYSGMSRIDSAHVEREMAREKGDSRDRGNSFCGQNVCHAGFPVFWHRLTLLCSLRNCGSSASEERIGF